MIYRVLKNIFIDDFLQLNNHWVTMTATTKNTDLPIYRIFKSKKKIHEINIIPLKFQTSCDQFILRQFFPTLILQNSATT